MWRDLRRGQLHKGRGVRGDEKAIWSGEVGMIGRNVCPSSHPLGGC